MMKLKKWLSGEEGGVDFIQLIVGLMIISIASVGTLQSLYYGYEKLDQQMRHRKAISVARSYAEYLQGRIHTDFDPKRTADQKLLGGNLNTPAKAMLDERDPTTDLDDIYCRVSHGRIVEKDDPQTGVGVDYYIIRVNVEWDEPEDHSWQPLHQVNFETRMVSADL